jgi:hypothetical protein
MSHQPAVRDPFYSTLAVAAAAVLCLAAFTPAGPQAPQAAPQAVVVAMPVASVRHEAPNVAQQATVADLELVGMSIANYDR